jgi:glucose-1-phosphate thymidylyltransferase
LEITTVNQIYLKNSELKVELLDKDFTWLDSGTHESMLEASNYIHTIEKRKGRKVACIEEIAFVLGYINSEELNSLVNPLKNNQYGKYLIEKVINKKQ